MNTETEVKTELSKEELQKQLEALDLKDAQDCINEIEVALKKYGCVQIPRGRFVGNEIVTEIAVTKKR